MFISFYSFMARHRQEKYSIIDQAIVSAANFIITILLARHLGLSEFGFFSLIWISVLIINSLQEAIIIRPMLTFGQKHTGIYTLYYYSMIYLQQIAYTILTSILLIIGLLIYDLFDRKLGLIKLAIPLALAASAIQIQRFIRQYFFSKKLVIHALVNDIICYGLQVIILVWLSIVEGITIRNILLTILTGSLIAVAFGIKGAQPFKWRGSSYCMKIIHTQWNFSKWLVSSTIMRWLPEYFIMAVVASNINTAAAGAIRASVTIMGVLHIINLGLDNSVPVTSAMKLVNNGIEEMKCYLLKISWIGGCITIFYSMIASIIPEYWMNLIFGSEYVKYAFVLQFTAVSYMIGFFKLPLTWYLRTIEHTRPIFLAELYRALFIIIFSIPLTKYLGLVGTLWGMLLSVTILQLTLFIKVRNHDNDFQVQ